MKLHGMIRRDTRTDAKYCIDSGVSLAFLSQVGVVTARYSHPLLLWLADAAAAIRPKPRGHASTTNHRHELHCSYSRGIHIVYLVYAAT